MKFSATSPIFFLCSLCLTLGACLVENPESCEFDDDCASGFVCEDGSRICVAESPPATPSAGDVPTPKDDAAIPVGWVGPLARAQAAQGEELPECSGDFGEELFLKHADLGTSGECVCQCGPAIGVSCSSGELSEWTSTEGTCELNQCNTINGSCSENRASIPANGCIELQSNMRDEPFLRAAFGRLSGGTCGSPTLHDDQLQAEFQSSTRTCLPQAAASECTAADCPLQVPEGFSEDLCIAREGVHSCPAESEFSEQHIVYSEIDDSRACDESECDCRPPEGKGCGGDIEITAGGEFQGCTTTLATMHSPQSFLDAGDFCSPIPQGARMARYNVDLTGFSCEGSRAFAPTGGAQGADATTLCCLPSAK